MSDASGSFSVNRSRNARYRTENSLVAGPGRIVWGHAVIGVGLLIRRLSGPAALLALVALVLARATPSGAGVGTALVLGIPVLMLLGGRILAVLVGAIGWIVFPPEHRAVLSDIASGP